MFDWKCDSPTGHRPWSFTARRKDGKVLAEFKHHEPTTYPAAKAKALAFFRDRVHERVTIAAEGA